MLHVATLRRPRVFALAAALAALAALPGVGHIHAAHADSVYATTSLAIGVHGTQDGFVGQTTDYTLTVTAAAGDPDAAPLEYSLSFPRENVVVVAFDDPAATCATFSNDSRVGVICEQDRLAAGASVTLRITVTFVAQANGAVFYAQAKAANSDFSVTDAGAKILPPPQPPTPPQHLPAGQISIPIGAIAPVAPS